MKLDHRSPALLLVLALGCTQDTSVGGRNASHTPEEPGTFSLVSIGNLAVREAASEDPCNRPFHGRFTIHGNAWHSLDSLPARCAMPGAQGGMAREDSGRIEFRGDTLDLFVRDLNIGELGLVQRGVLRGDTLLLWGSDLDGGDYVYVRRRDE